MREANCTPTKIKDMKAQIRVIGMSILLFSATLLLLPSRCEAQVKKMSTQELTKESTSILYGKCTKMKSAWTEDRRMILTTVTLIPEYYLKGNLGSEVNITVPGGQVDDIIYEVSEMPAFRTGEEVIAFIWKHPSGKNLITGGAQGKMRISTDPQTGKKTIQGKALGKDAPAQTILEPVPVSKEATKNLQPTTLPKTKPSRVSLDDFTKEVEGYLIER
jgi:hypothetical protein